jgi:hypothetical protein
MPALYPVSVAPEDYRIGDSVKWFIDATNISPYVGKVVAISPKIHKVWVTWPIGDTVQHAPEELILIPPTMGLSVVNHDNGYDSYDKQLSAENFGTLTPTARRRLASQVARKFAHLGTDEITLEDKAVAPQHKQAADLSAKFKTKLASDLYEKALSLKTAGSTQVEAYVTMYNKYADSFGDRLIRDAVMSVFA